MTTRDRRRGMLLGLAVGDALGAAVEFKPPGTFEQVTGYRDGGPHGLEPGEWTDDTSMALALADSIAHAGWDLDNQATRYREGKSSTAPGNPSPSSERSTRSTRRSTRWPGGVTSLESLLKFGDQAMSFGRWRPPFGRSTTRATSARPCCEPSTSATTPIPRARSAANSPAPAGASPASPPTGANTWLVETSSSRPSPACWDEAPIASSPATLQPAFLSAAAFFFAAGLRGGAYNDPNASFGGSSGTFSSSRSRFSSPFSSVTTGA